LLAPTPEEPDVFWKRKRDTPVVSPQVVTVEDLRVRAGKALVTADDAVRAASEELSYAQAQFGLSATDPFTAALETARGHLARSFELRKLLDDDIPETEPVQRQMYSEILQRCNDAVGIITLIEPWACGEQPVPGATATSPVNRPWPTAYPDSD